MIDSPCLPSRIAACFPVIAERMYTRSGPCIRCYIPLMHNSSQCAHLQSSSRRNHFKYTQYHCTSVNPVLMDFITVLCSS